MTLIQSRLAIRDAHLAKLVGEIETKAHQSAHATVKYLARNYARHPALIDRVHAGASRMPLGLLYERLKVRLAFHRSAEAFGAYLQQPINIKAAMLAARYLMLRERAEARRGSHENRNSLRISADPRPRLRLVGR